MPKILVVDDDKSLTDSIVERLSLVGHKCAVRKNGNDALAALDAGQLDLVVLDIMLPDISGFEVCRRIRANIETCTIPILFLSAMSGQEEIEHGLAQGADDYLAKPFSFPDLVRRVGSLITSNGQGRGPDKQTSLPGPKGTKFEIQRRINAKQEFGLIYIELMGIGDFARHRNADARDLILRHFARALNLCGKKLNADQYFAGHMGGGHYVCIVPPAQLAAFCGGVRNVWEEHLPKLLSSIEGENVSQEQAMKRASAHGALLAPLFCATIHHPKEKQSSRDLFGIVSNLRENALASGGAGIYIDRRS